MKRQKEIQARSKAITLFAFLFIILVLAQGAFAADKERGFRIGKATRKGNEGSLRPTGKIRLDGPTYGGNGCPQGTMRVVFAPDNLSFSMLFDNFVAEVPNPDARNRRDRMTCDAVIPITIPEGMQMEITRVDFRGFVGLPSNARASLHSVFNFKGRANGRDGERMNLRFNFNGPVMEDYEISSDVLAANGAPAQTEVSPCGGDVRLNVYNEVRINSRSREQASVSIDSIDGSSNALYYVNWRSCASTDSRGGRPDRVVTPPKGNPRAGFSFRIGR